MQDLPKEDDDGEPVGEPTPNGGREENDDGKRRSTEVMNLGSNENVKLWANGIPELTGEEEVKKMFKGLSDKDPTWSYLGAYKLFAKKYPRAASGDPKDPWKAQVCNDDSLIRALFGRMCCLQPSSTSTPDGTSRHASNGSVRIPMPTLDERDHTEDHPHEDASLLA